MIDKMTVIEKIFAAFRANEYPGDHFLQGSWEGSEPFEEIEPFKGKQKWKEIEPDFLDRHAAALSFFSEAGLRFFLPAFLVADLQDQLQVADPVFHLTHGFSEEQVEHTIQGRVFIVRTGRTVFVNPRRYGAVTFYDYARYRLSIFTREEAGAIVEYLKYQREKDELGIEKTWIDAALDIFWLERSERAPTEEELKRHLREQSEYVAALEGQSRSR
jgi:hypothetical protein